MTFRFFQYSLGALLLFLLSCGNPAEQTFSVKTVNIRLESPANIINPTLPSTGYARYVAQQVFQTIGTFDPVEYELVPMLVKTIPAPRAVTEGNFKDYIAYDFELLDSAQWDNGSAVTAADMAFSLKIIFNPLLPAFQWRDAINNLKGFEADPSNPKKFTLYVKEYKLLGLEGLCQFPVYPAWHYDPGNLMQQLSVNDLLDPKKAELLSTQDKGLQEFAAAFMQPGVGTEVAQISASGPYKVVFFDPQQGATLVKKANWWGDALVSSYPALAAYPDTLNYKFVKEEDAAINMLRSGELDIATNFSAAKFLELQNDADLKAHYDFKTNWSAMFNRVFLNLRDPILSDKNVRQALAYSVNYDEMLQDIQQGLAQRTIGAVHPDKPFYAKNITPYQLNPEKAKALLAASGWTDTDNDGVADKMINGVKTDLAIDFMTTTGTPSSDMIAASLQASAAKAGIKLNVKPTSLASITKETLSGNFQMAAAAAAMHPGLVDLSALYHSKNIPPEGGNRALLANAELDKVMDELMSTQDEARRNELYVKAQEILNEEVPELYLYAVKVRFIINNKFDYTLSALRPGYHENLIRAKK